MKKFKVGIIGCGNIFKMHAVSLNYVENAELVAVCDIKEDRVKQGAKRFNCRYYLDYKEMINKEDLDVVHILTPHYLHSPMAIYAANAKKHILTEKPMSISIEQAEAMLKAAEDNNIILGVIFQNRFNDGAILVKETLNSGALGKIMGVKMILTWNRTDEYYSLSDWKGTWDKEGGGVIIDQSIHSLDLLRWLINSDIEYIEANINNRAHQIIQVEDSAEGVIKFKNGVFASFYAMNYYPYDSDIEIEFYCESGVAKITGEIASIKLNNGREYIAKRDPNEMVDFGEGVKGYWGVSHVRQVRDYYKSLSASRKPAVTGEEAFKTQKLVCAIYESGKMKKRIIF